MISLEWQNLSVQLRSPDLQNPEDHVLGIQRKFDMAGRQHTWIPPRNGSKVHTLTIRAMTREQMYDVRDFLVASAGHEIKYTDSYGVAWVGRIITNNHTIISDGDCKDYITLQFEGVRSA